MGGSPPDVRRLHQLLSARAYLRVALYSVRMCRVYLDSRKDPCIKDLTGVEELLEGVIEYLDKEIGFMVYGSPPELKPDEKVQRLVEETVFGSSGASVTAERSKLPVVIKRSA